MEEKIKKIVYLIQISDLDQTIKDILVRDLQSQGLTEFLREQIRAYCLDGLRKMDVQTEEAKQILEESPLSVPSPSV